MRYQVFYTHNANLSLEIQNLNKAEGHTEYTYDFLLERVSAVMKDKNPSGTAGGLSINKLCPYIGRVGSTKTLWANFNEIVTAIDRTHEHVMNYITSELGTDGSLSTGEQNLIL